MVQFPFADMEGLRARYLDILNTLCNKYGLAGAVAACEGNAGSLRYNWEHEGAANELGLQFSNGATRLVMWSEDEEYVIKIQFNEDHEYYGNNYNELELAAYNAAVENGWEDMFAPIAKLFDYSFTDSIRVGVYAMAYCDCDQYGIEDETYRRSFDKYCKEYGRDPEDRETQEEFSDDWCEYDGNYIESALSYNGYQEHDYDKFCDFLRNQRINDLHSGNWGYLDGRLVLVDYSGYGRRNGFDF